MTDYKTLSDSELTEALNFHRRQRNLSNGINEAAHMRQTQVVRLLEAEEDRRLNEENPNHYIISKRKSGEYGVAQDLGNNVWDHSYHHGTHKTLDAAKAWAAKHAGKYPHKIEVKEEVEQIDELSKKTLGSYIKKAGGTSLDSAGAHMADYGANKNPKSFKKGINRAKGVMQAADRLTKEEVEQIDELSKKTLGSYVKKASTDQYLKGQAVQYHTNKANDSKGSAFEKESKKKHMNAADDALRKASNRDTGIGRAVDRLTKEEFEQLDELSPKTLHSYIKKADKHMDKLDRTIRKSDETIRQSDMARHKLGGAARKADDAQSEKSRRAADTEYGRAQRKVGTTSSAADEARKIKSAAQRKMDKRYSGVEKAYNRLGEEVELDEASKPNQYIEVINKFTGAKSHHEVHPSKAFAALNHHNRLWNTKSARIVSGKEAEEIRASKMKKEEVEQIDEISVDLKKRYVEKGGEDVYNRFTGRGKYEKPRDPSKYTKTGRPKKSALNSPESVKYREKLANRRAIVNKVSQEVHGKNRFSEEVELGEASYRDIGYANMLKADRKAEKELAKLRAQQAKDAAKASKPEEFKEESNLRITKVYNKWPKPATYAVHNADRSYHKEFDSMEAAQAHKAEKSK